MSDCSPMLPAAERHIIDEGPGEGPGEGAGPSPLFIAAVQRRTVRVLIAAQLLGALGLAAGGTAG
jgi:hypothetical protein